MTPISHFQDLVAWQRAMDVVSQVYALSRNWPRDEQFGLTNQIRRAAVSVPSNIAEGQGRTGRREFAHHLSVAHGSLCEVETHVRIAQRLGYLGPGDASTVLDSVHETGRLIRGLIQRLSPLDGVREDPLEYEAD